MPDRMPEYLSGRLPDRMPEYLSGRLPDRMPDHLSDRMPEYLPDTMSEYMSDKLSLNKEYMIIYVQIYILKCHGGDQEVKYVFLRSPLGYGHDISIY